MSGAAIFGLAFALVVFDAVVCFRLQSVVIQERTSGICPASVAEARANASQRLSTISQNNLTVSKCGPGYWVRVASLKMTDPQQNCPSPWVMETTPGRSCAIVSPPCASVYFDTFSVMYRKVCGMALGYATDTPDSFFGRNAGIDSSYLDGVSITYGQPRQHIWSLAAGHAGRCPCDNTDRNVAPLPPSLLATTTSVMVTITEHCGMVKAAPLPAAPLPAAPSTILRGLQSHFLLLLQTALRPGSAMTHLLVMSAFFSTLYHYMCSRCALKCASSM